MAITKVSNRRMLAAERRARALQMRLRNPRITLQQIGDELGVSKEAVRKMLLKELERVNEENGERIELMRARETAVLDELQGALWDHATAEGTEWDGTIPTDGEGRADTRALHQAITGEAQVKLAAVGAILNISKRRAKLWGLDMPMRSTVDHVVRVDSEDELRDKIFEKFEEMRERREQAQLPEYVVEASA